MIIANASDSTLDTTAPSVTITGPTSSSTYQAGVASSVTVSGTASDAAGIAICRWSNALTGQSGNATTSGNGDWTVAVPVAQGDNSITITCLDPGGNLGTDTITITRSAPTIVTLNVGALRHTGRVLVPSIVTPTTGLSYSKTFAGISWTSDLETNRFPNAGVNDLHHASKLGTGWVGGTDWSQADALNLHSLIVPTGGPNGGGFYRHPRYFATNNGGLSTRMNIQVFHGVSGLREFHYKWYQRWPTGMRPCTNASVTGLFPHPTQGPGTGVWNWSKDMYFNNGTGRRGDAVAGYGGSGWGLACDVAGVGGGRCDFNVSSHSWLALQGGIGGSGLWDTFEVYMKADDGSVVGQNGTANGEIGIWINGVNVTPAVSNAGITGIPYNRINWSGGNPSWVGWEDILYGSNQGAVGNDSTDWWVDFSGVFFSLGNVYIGDAYHGP